MNVVRISLILKPGVQLQEGDCGSWVIDSESQEVYGYVVAVDAFGEASVVPLISAFEDIKVEFAAQSINIAKSDDIERWNRLSRRNIERWNRLSRHNGRNSNLFLSGAVTPPSYDFESFLPILDSGYSSFLGTPDKSISVPQLGIEDTKTSESFPALLERDLAELLRPELFTGEVGVSTSLGTHIKSTAKRALEEANEPNLTKRKRNYDLEGLSKSNEQSNKYPTAEL